LKEKWGCEYSLVGMRVVTAALKWRKRRFPGTPIKFVFESGDLGQHHLERCLKEERLPYAFIPAMEEQKGQEKYIVPFQIADFAAWEFRAAYARMHDGYYDHNFYPDDPLRGLRQSFQALYKQIPQDIGNVLTEDGLRGLCAQKNLNR
jgi:hypothetical protein